MAASCFDASVAQHGFGALVDVTGQKSVNLQYGVETVNDARASATDTTAKKDVKRGVPDACLPGAWDAGPGQDGMLMGRASDQKDRKKDRRGRCG